MEPTSTFTHPTLDHFLHFHLGPLSFTQEDDTESWTGPRILQALKKKGFPFTDTCLGADVIREDEGSRNPNNQVLMCAKGETTMMALTFLADKRQSDRENDRDRTYGPITITALDHLEEFAAYYDAAVRDLFTTSVVHTLFADATTMKTSWYGQVNSHDQKKYLEAIINQLVHLPGISTLLASQLNTSRGAMILTDSTRSASLAISIMRSFNPHASDRVIYTAGFTCFVQHFGALFNSEQPYYPGKLYQGLDEALSTVFASLGLSEDTEGALSEIDVDLQEVFRILRRTPDSSEKQDDPPTALYYCFWITNHLVATYFTERKRVYEDGAFIFKRNPSYSNVDKTMDRLDALFSNVAFYRFHRNKIARFINNADRYYRLHIISSLDQGGFVSKTELKAFGIDKRRE